MENLTTTTTTTTTTTVAIGDRFPGLKTRHLELENCLVKDADGAKFFSTLDSVCRVTLILS